MMAQMATSLPAMQETWVQSLGREDPWRRRWQSTPVFLPGKAHGWRSLAGYSPWGHKESDMTERLTHTHDVSEFSPSLAPDSFGCMSSSNYLLLFDVNLKISIGSVQSFSHVQLFANPWTVAHQASLSVTNSWSLLKLMSIELVMPSNPPHPVLSPSPPTLNLSQDQGLFKWVSSLHQVAKVLAFQHQHQSFQWIFRTDFL